MPTDKVTEWTATYIISTPPHVVDLSTGGVVIAPTFVCPYCLKEYGMYERIPLGEHKAPEKEKP